MMGTCENMCETPLRYLIDKRMRSDRFVFSHPREDAYSPSWPNRHIIIITTNSNYVFSSCTYSVAKRNVKYD